MGGSFTGSIQCWPEAAEELVQDCLESVDWPKCRKSADNLDRYATTVTDFISKCMEDCTPKKSIWLFPNRNSWMSWEIHCRPKTRHAAFKLDDPNLYRKSRCDLHKVIKVSKGQYWTKLEAQTNPYRQLPPVARPTRMLAKQYHLTPTAPDAPVPCITTADIRSVFLRVNPRKATGPDGVPGSEVPTCFKKTTVIPVSKKTLAKCLNDCCPVALTSVTRKCFERLIMAHINSSFPACLDPLQFANRLNRKKEDLAPIHIDRAEMERVESVKFLGVTIKDDLSWTSHVDATVKKAQQHLFFL
eukprot:g38137.t1